MPEAIESGKRLKHSKMGEWMMRKCKKGYFVALLAIALSCTASSYAMNPMKANTQQQAATGTEKQKLLIKQTSQELMPSSNIHALVVLNARVTQFNATHFRLMQALERASQLHQKLPKQNKTAFSQSMTQGFGDRGDNIKHITAALDWAIAHGNKITTQLHTATQTTQDAYTKESKAGCSARQFPAKTDIDDESEQSNNGRRTNRCAKLTAYLFFPLHKKA